MVRSYNTLNDLVGQRIDLKVSRTRQVVSGTVVLRTSSGNPVSKDSSQSQDNGDFRYFLRTDNGHEIQVSNRGKNRIKQTKQGGLTLNYLTI
ncbi:MAG: hypothetical protein KKF56_04070 [Nanoarchaeota archaeon]|nr:hypothetical protein [Nanoarchaeota archaeon]